jgi:hypothetical protein
VELSRSLTDDQRAQVFLPLKSGGCGLASADWRRCAAYLGSWELCLRDVALVISAPTGGDVARRAPRVAAAIQEASLLIGTSVPGYRFDWGARFGLPLSQCQRHLASDVLDAKLQHLLAVLPPEGKVDVLSAGGTGAGSFLLPPTDVACHMCDEHLAVALRRRLRCAHPARDTAPGSPSHCNHRYPGGTACGELLDSRGHHAAVCKTGGAVLRGHDRLRDWLAKWLEEVSGAPTSTEQYVPQWDTVEPDGSTKHARLDVSFVDASGARAFVDVAVVSASSASPVLAAQRADDPGRAAKDAVRGKRCRYPAHRNPGCGLVPFVVEALGRPSEEAIALLRSMTPATRDRSATLGAAWQHVSVIVQTRLAELLLSAESSGR